MSDADEARWFEDEKQHHETKYLAGTNPRQQSGFGRDERDWARFRRPIAAAIHKSGAFLDIGCASGLLMESVSRWAAERGHAIDAYGVDISDKLVALARRRLPTWADRIFVGNALYWEPPRRFDFIRTELVYVPDHRRADYVVRLLDRMLTLGGRLIICSYGSSKPEGARAELLLDQLAAWGMEAAGVEDFVSEEHGFVITRAVWIERRAPSIRSSVRILNG